MGHEAYPAQVLLVESHDAFCRIAADIVERLEVLSQPDDEMRPKRRSRLLRHTATRFDDWMWAMRSHEGYEERKLYPFLERRFSITLGHLRRGHEALHNGSDAVKEAFSKAVQAASAPESVPGWPHLDAALASYLNTLELHLLDEEASVIPRLLDLSAEEFARYSRSSVAELLQGN
jgi:hypothetical protein